MTSANHKIINLMEIQKNHQKQQSLPEGKRSSSKSTNLSASTQQQKGKLRFINKRNSQQPTHTNIDRPVAKIDGKKQNQARQQAQPALRPQAVSSKPGRAMRAADLNKQQTTIGLVKARDGSVERRVGDEDQIQFDEDEFRDAGAAAASDKE